MWMKTTYLLMKVNWVLGAVLLLAVLIIGFQTSYLSGDAITTSTHACKPISLVAGQGKIVFGKPVHLTDVISAGTILLSVTDVTTIITTDKPVSIGGLTIEVVDTRFTPAMYNRVANLMICENVV